MSIQMLTDQRIEALHGALFDELEVHERASGEEDYFAVQCGELMSVLREVQELRKNIVRLEAESARMKLAIKNTVAWQESVDAGNAESVRPLLEIETTSVESFVADIKAQGVELFEHQAILINRNCTASEVQKSLTIISSNARRFAQQLRSGEIK